MCARQQTVDRAWTKTTAEILPARPYKFNYNFLNMITENEFSPKPQIEKTKAILRRTVKNAKLVDYSERKNEEEIKVFERLK